jgi:hypothetical protein
LGWVQKAAVLNMAGLLLAFAVDAGAQSASSDFGWLEASWCSEVHDDYRPGRPVVEIRQIRRVRPQVDPQSKAVKEVALELRSAVVSADSGTVEMVGGWIEFRFQAKEDRLVDAGVQVTLALTPERSSLSYRYGEGKAHRHVHCAAAGVELEEGKELPAAVSIARHPSPPPPAGRQAPAAERDESLAGQAAENVHLNRSHCFMLRKSRNGYLGLENQCSTSANYTYCVVNPTTRHGRFFVCRTMTGTQLGRGSGSVQPASTGYLGLPNNERGKVVWFACESPSLPALMGAAPPRGRCQ